MTEREVFIAACGIDEDGEGKSTSVIETLNVSPDPEKEPEVIKSLMFDGVPVNIFRSLRQTMIDLMFRDNTDYDFIQALQMLRDFSKAENSLEDEAETIPAIQVTIIPNGLDEAYYVTAVHGTWHLTANEPAELPNIIRFIFDNEVVHTYRLAENAINNALETMTEAE